MSLCLVIDDMHPSLPAYLEPLGVTLHYRPELTAAEVPAEVRLPAALSSVLPFCCPSVGSSSRCLLLHSIHSPSSMPACGTAQSTTSPRSCAGLPVPYCLPAGTRCCRCHCGCG